MDTQDESLIFDFKTQQNTTNWLVVNDGVMGGLSKGSMSMNDAGNGLFSGSVTTENNGGFSSVKYGFSIKDVSRFKSVKLRVKGDGKTYQFRMKSDQTKEYSYVNEFQTSGDWEIITLPFADFHGSFRGNKLGIPNYNGKLMEEVRFLIGNKRKEDFALEIERIWLE
ncbi:CIA30 family protein [Gelidibacter gilvus]|uniref:CIA30 family protein n=1 Tax=Gelidibacter gilvus TaxID=59602 RepID=A0A4Q0XI27_9FLAO|nr:CIA30 family protein [Gelidibacter gilvus]RXJ51244.1 CIA30 family protein [Gelidibacter gilvus]